jgi:sulfur-oxidizing protein SoxX
MRLSAHYITTTASVLALTASVGLITPVTVNADAAADIAAGKELAFDRKKGNCLACHQIAGGTLEGNIGPPLVAMKARFPGFDDLKAQIYDARVKNPDTIMIPFGPHGVLSNDEITLVTKFIHTL